MGKRRQARIDAEIARLRDSGARRYIIGDTELVTRDCLERDVLQKLLELEERMDETQAHLSIGDFHD